jgi:predicted nucleic acid-binding Zn ribbon protein
MYYRFQCIKCKCEEEKNIPVSEYDTEKEKQICSNCGAKMKRVIEWGGIATGSGDGWFGRSDGGTAI